jgi:DNA polymerase-3 subunit beta
MNVIVLKNNLKEALSIISGARKESGNLPILKNFLLETKDGRLKLSSTDLEIGITKFLSAKIIQEGSLAIPYVVFTQIINNLASERVSIETKGNSLLITADNYKAKIGTAPKEDFPIIPEIQEKKGNYCECETDYFIDSLSSVVSACQISDIRPELSGIYFSFKEDQIKLAATDSFRLAEKTIIDKKFESNFDKDFSCIIPLKTITEVTRIFSSKNDGKLKIIFDSNQILFENEHTHIVSRLIEGKFPEYELIIPKNFETETVMDKNDLTGALKLASSLSNRLNEVKFITDENLKNINVFSSSQEFGESEYLLPAKIKGQATRVTYNWKFVLEGLKNIKSQNVFIGFNGEDKATLLKSPEDQSFVYIVMPIKSA